MQQAAAYVCFSNYAIIGLNNGLSSVDSKPLSEPMMANCHSDHWEQTSVRL